MVFLFTSFNPKLIVISSSKDDNKDGCAALSLRRFRKEYDTLNTEIEVHEFD